MHVHGDNLNKKIADAARATDTVAQVYLVEIGAQYKKWVDANQALKGPLGAPSDRDMQVIEQRVKLFADYKDFIDQQKYAEKFDSRSNLHSTVLEEFMHYLFRDLVDDLSKSALIGKAHTFKDIFFMPSSYKEMLKNPCLRIEEKDHDFVIGVRINVQLCCNGQIEAQSVVLEVPAIAIECKTYLDKTMLEGSSMAAEQLRLRNPNAAYIVAAEWLKLTEAVNLKKYKLDQIYVLRKQKNTDREFRFLSNYVKNPVYADVVAHLFERVRTHLTTDWVGGVKAGLERGYLLD